MAERPSRGVTVDARHRPTVDRARFDALLIDLDGVVTRTSALHGEAWKAVFDEFLRRHGRQDGRTWATFDLEEDYRAHVEGRPRHDGVRSFLRSRGIHVPEGHPGDPPGHPTIWGLGNRKNEVFLDLLRRRGVEVLAGSREFLERARRAGFALAIVSSSRNCARVLRAAGLSNLFDVRVDGNHAARSGLPGKPEPAMFEEAARRLAVTPARCAVVEDAASGVRAARAGAFGLIVGVDPGDRADALRAAGADLVVPSLAELGIIERSDVGSPANLPSALDALEEIRRRLEGRRPAVFLDYDGTLTPIVDRPELAVLSDEMRATVDRLASHCPVAVISGRTRADVERLVGLGSVVYAGTHGFDIAGPGGLGAERQEARNLVPVFARVADDLRRRLADVSGVIVEDKQFAVAVHYRLVADEDVPLVARAVNEAVAGQPGLRRTGGKCVFELRPDLDWDKGRAVLWLLEVLHLDGPDVLPFYVGDDVTDWDAFRALRDRGIGVIVDGGEGETHARYRLRDTGEVRRFLEALARA